VNAITDASPLIACRQLPRLVDLIAKQFDRVLVTEAVFREAVGVAMEHPDPERATSARELLRRFEAGPFSRTAMKRGERLDLRLGPGELEAISLAHARKIRTLLVDDAKASRVAASLGLQPVSTVAIVVRGFRRSHVASAEARALVQRLLEVHLFLSPGVVSRILSMLD